jgi:hypothetical protein
MTDITTSGNAGTRPVTKVLANGSRQLAVANGNGARHHARGTRDLFSLPGLVIRQVDEKLVATLSGNIFAIAAESERRRELIDRLFAIPALRTARIHGKKGEIRLEFPALEISPEEIITALARAMGGSKPSSLPLPHEELILDGEAPSSFSIQRSGAELTLWQVDAPTSQFYRIVHPLLRHEHVRKRVIDELATLSDVVLRSLYLPIAGKDVLLVFGRPHRIDPGLFREVLDPVLTRSLAEGPSQPAPSIRDELVNANLGLAVITDFLAPPLGIANIALTGTLGVGYVPRALAELRQGRVTLELLYLIIAAFTIVTYEFLPAAVMYWLMRFWPRRSRQLYDSHYSRFVSRYRLRPRRVWVDRAGTSVETRVEDLTPTSVVTLTAGDIVPGDGHITEGDAQIDEGVLTGTPLAVEKKRGSAIYAASRIVEGSVRFKIDRLGEDTAVGHIARWHDEAHFRDLAETQAHQAAEKTVLPVLLITALATLTGGLTAAKAVIRPDYATGPALSENLGRLASVIRAANHGILLPGEPALQKWAGPVSLLFDDTVNWQLPEGAIFVELAYRFGIEHSAFFSSRPAAVARQQASRLGFAEYHAESSSRHKLEFIAAAQQVGRTVIYVGDCHAERQVATQANLAVTVAEPPFHRLSKSTTTLLAPDLLKVLELRSIALDSIAEQNTAFNVSLVPNVAAVAAGFLFASPVYLTVLLTNLGTLANYARSETILQLTGRSGGRV